jgi:hypothetical protein
MSQSDSARHLLRHAVATLAYRGGKAVRGAPDTFAEFHASQDTRTPGQILAHIGDLLDWALSAARGSQKWHDSSPLPWPEEVARFFAALEAFDAYLASDGPLQAPAEKLLQAPIADALTHIGQIAILRRLAGAPVGAENYYVAKIAVGCVGPDQPAPVQEFSTRCAAFPIRF